MFITYDIRISNASYLFVPPPPLLAEEVEDLATKPSARNLRQNAKKAWWQHDHWRLAAETLGPKKKGRCRPKSEPPSTHESRPQKLRSRTSHSLTAIYSLSPLKCPRSRQAVMPGLRVQQDIIVAYPSDLWLITSSLAFGSWLFGPFWHANSHRFSFGGPDRNAPARAAATVLARMLVRCLMISLWVPCGRMLTRKSRQHSPSGKLLQLHWLLCQQHPFPRHNRRTRQPVGSLIGRTHSHMCWCSLDWKKLPKAAPVLS